MRRGSRLGQFRSNILDSWALRIIPLNLAGSGLLREEGCEGMWAVVPSACATLPASSGILARLGQSNPPEQREGGPRRPRFGSKWRSSPRPWQRDAWRRGEADARTKEPAVAPGTAQAGVKWHAKLNSILVQIHQDRNGNCCCCRDLLLDDCAHELR